MTADLLISWKVLTQMAASASSSYETWLAERHKTLSLHLCLYSYFKAVGDSERVAADARQSPGIIDAFVRRHFPPESLLNPGIVSAAAYNDVRRRYGRDDLELFAIALALVRDFTYVCADEIEADEVRQKLPRLKVALISEYIDAA